MLLDTFFIEVPPNKLKDFLYGVEDSFTKRAIPSDPRPARQLALF